MRGTNAAFNAHRINEEVQRIKNVFYSNPNMKCRAVTKVVKYILLNGPYLIQGRSYEIKSKSLGAGVYELTAELQKD